MWFTTDMMFARSETPKGQSNEHLQSASVLKFWFWSLYSSFFEVEYVIQLLEQETYFQERWNMQSVKMKKVEFNS